MAVRSTLLIVAVGLCLLAGGTAAAEIRVAVAANFAPTLHRLAEAFTAATGHRLLIYGISPEASSAVDPDDVDGHPQD